MIVITGASGQLGRLVADALAKRVSPAEVTLGCRQPGRIEAFAARGFATVALDFDDPAGMRSAFAGANVVLIISGDAPDEVRIRQHRAAVDAAKASRAGRVIYTSFTNPTPASLFPFAAIHADTEAYLMASGLPYTILRNNQYAENIAGALATAKATGTLALPEPQGKVAHITRADVAEAMAGAAVQDGHDGKVYEVTGPQALNLFDVADILSRAWQRPIKVVDMDPADFGSALTSRGAPPFAVEAVIRLRRAAAAGEYARVSDDARHLAGRMIESMSQYVERS